MFSLEVFPEGFFLSDAFLFLLSGMFKYSHFTEKKPLFKHSQIYMLSLTAVSPLILAISLETVRKHQLAQVFI